MPRMVLTWISREGTGPSGTPDEAIRSVTEQATDNYADNHSEQSLSQFVFFFVLDGNVFTIGFLGHAT